MNLEDEMIRWSLTRKNGLFKYVVTRSLLWTFVAKGIDCFLPLEQTALEKGLDILCWWIIFSTYYLYSWFKHEDKYKEYNNM